MRRRRSTLGANGALMDRAARARYDGVRRPRWMSRIFRWGDRGLIGACVNRP